MTDEQRKSVHDITYSTDDRMELAERIVALEDENAKLKNNSNYLHEMLSESRQANEHLYAELKRHKSILRTRPNAMTALYDENAKLRELAHDALLYGNERSYGETLYKLREMARELGVLDE